MLKLNVRRISTRLSLGAALALMATAANANTFTIDATWLDGPGTISGSFTMTPGDWSTIANVNVQATLPYTGSNAVWATRYDHRSSDVQQRKLCAECPQQRRWLYLANEYQQACRVLPHCPRRNAANSDSANHHRLQHRHIWRRACDRSSRLDALVGLFPRHRHRPCDRRSNHCRRSRTFDMGDDARWFPGSRRGSPTVSAQCVIRLTSRPIFRNSRHGRLFSFEEWLSPALR